MIKEGKASVGDGKDVHHKKPLSAGGTSVQSNLQVVSRAKNRGMPETARTSRSKKNAGVGVSHHPLVSP